MTEPDEALLWARERAARWQDEGGGEAGPAYRRGGLDFLLGEEVEGYRAGAAASAERIKELEAEVRELKEALVAVVMEATARDVPITTDTIRFSAPIRALLKDPDQ